MNIPHSIGEMLYTVKTIFQKLTYKLKVRLRIKPFCLFQKPYVDTKAKATLKNNKLPIPTDKVIEMTTVINVRVSGTNQELTH